MTHKDNLLLLAAGLVWAGCLHFLPDCGALHLPLLIALLFASLLNPLETVLTVRGLGRWPAFPTTGL